MTCAFRIAMAALVVLSSSVLGQSTAGIGEAERPLRAEVSVGIDHQSIYGGAVATVTSAAVAVRWAPSTAIGIRALVHGLRRYSNSVQSYTASERDSTETDDRVLAFTIDTDVSFRIWRDLMLSPSVGGGFAPYAHGRQSTTRVRAMPELAPSEYGNYSRSDVGVIWTLGLALRYRHVVVEKKAIGLLGAESAIRQGREYYPWTIGYRF